MPTPLDKQGYLEAIEEAISLGVSSVTFEGRQTNFRSLADMRSIREELKRELTATPKRVRRTVAAYDGGFGCFDRDRG